MQLNFLGEDFDPDLCDQMCDNCRRDIEVTQKDMTDEAVKLASAIKDITESKGNVTLAQIVDIMRGKKVQAKSIKDFLINRHKGCL